VVLDTETTGLTPSVDHVIELAVLIYTEGQVTIRSNLIKAVPAVPVKITEITGISTAMLTADGRPPAEVFSLFLNMPEVNNLPILGHNILAFDRLFLLHDINRHLGAEGYERAQEVLHPSKMIDSGALYKGLVMKSPPVEGESHLAWSTRIMEARRAGLKWNLQLAAKQMGVRPGPRDAHRADGDVVLCHQLFQKILEMPDADTN